MEGAQAIVIISLRVFMRSEQGITSLLDCTRTRRGTTQPYAED